MTETPQDIAARLRDLLSTMFMDDFSRTGSPANKRLFERIQIAHDAIDWTRAALDREAGLRTALDAILEHCRNDGIEPSTVAERVLERVEDTALAALAVKP